MIFYFSGTGNTKWAANELAQQTGDRLLFIPDELKGDCCYTLEPNERIGFCFPVHGWQPPAIVKSFVKRLEIKSCGPEHFCFALCTCGDNTGDAMKILDRLLRPKGLQLQSAYSLIMPETYVCLPFMHTDTREREDRKIAQATLNLAIITEEIKERRKGNFRVGKGPAPLLYSYIIGEFFNRWMITDKPFKVSLEKCSGCGRCAHVCPTQNISLDSHKHPMYKHRLCTCCLACYHHCPLHAINYGPLTKKRGQYFFNDRMSSISKSKCLKP